VSRARVVNLIDMTPDKPGPVELQTLEVTRQAAAQDIEVVAYFSGPVPDGFRIQMEAAGGRVGVFDGTRTRWKSEVIAVCAQEDPDIAHFHFGPHLGFTEVARKGARVVFTEHSPREPQQMAALRPVVRHWRTRHVDLFVAVSEFIGRQVMRDFAVGRSRVRVVRNATDIEHFRPRPGERERLRRELLGLDSGHVVVTIAAHMRPAKRQDMAILAMPEILRIAPQTRLVLAGDGPERERLHQLVDRHGVGETVLFRHGANDVAALYAASDVALLPSIGEGLPGGGIEAIACGLPLVATPNGGTPEVYEEGVSGISVTDQTSHGLAAALVPLVTDPVRRAQMGRAARQRAEQVFAIARPARETLAVYGELLDGRQPRPAPS
jgi:glycosyltransferase involved in cell wall biosynthesis